jgi:hypothetical protein
VLQVWQPLEASEKWEDVWRTKMAARADAIELAARLKDAVQQAEVTPLIEARSSSLNNSGTNATEVSAIHLELLDGVFAEDAGTSELSDDWEEVPFGRKMKATAAAASAAAAADMAESATGKGKRRGRGYRGSRGQKENRCSGKAAEDPVQNSSDAGDGDDVNILLMEEAATHSSCVRMQKFTYVAGDVGRGDGMKTGIGEDMSGCGRRGRRGRGRALARRGVGRGAPQCGSICRRPGDGVTCGGVVEHCSSRAEIGVLQAQIASQGDPQHPGHGRRFRGRQQKLGSEDMHSELPEACTDQRPLLSTRNTGRGRSSARGLQNGHAAPRGGSGVSDSSKGHGNHRFGMGQVAEHNNCFTNALAADAGVHVSDENCESRAFKSCGAIGRGRLVGRGAHRRRGGRGRGRGHGAFDSAAPRWIPEVSA